MGTHRVGLLCAGGRVSLGVLVSLDQQLDQAGDDGGLLQRGMVGWTQSQVADQAYGSLEEGGVICLSCGSEQHVLPKRPTGCTPLHLSHPIPSVVQTDSASPHPGSIPSPS